MAEFDINKAARIMRAGNEFSETNKKLREAIWSFAEWLLECVGDEADSMREIGWRVHRQNNKQVMLAFMPHFEDDIKKTKSLQRWGIILTHSDRTNMEMIAECCRRLAGSDGDRLMAWLEKQSQERGELLAGSTKTREKSPTPCPDFGDGRWSMFRSKED
jgi:hypothetical protein